MMEFTPQREIAHARQDLAVTKEIICILKSENNRLRSVVDGRSSELSQLGKEMGEYRKIAQDERLAFEAEITRLKEGSNSLSSELAEALTERKRLSELLHTVRSQVDGRLTKLTEELHIRDETIHRLDFQSREYEREIDRINRTLKDEISKASDAERTQENYSQQTKAEISLLCEQIEEGKMELAAVKKKLQESEALERKDESQSSRIPEVFSVLLLYRQWLLELDRSMDSIEDQLEGALSGSLDSLLLLTSSGVPYKPPVFERKRMAELKRVERERKKADLDTFSYSDVSDLQEDSINFVVHSIRRIWDFAKHSIEKVKIVSLQLVEASKDTLTVSEKISETLMLSKPQEKPGKETSISDSPNLQDISSSSFQKLLNSYEDQLRQKDCEISNLKTYVSGLEAQCNTLREELLKSKDELMNTSFKNVAKSGEFETKLRDTVKSVEDSFAKAQRDMTLQHERKLKILEEENLSLQNSLADQERKMESMKALLMESKKRRISLKDENSSMRAQVQRMEDTVNSLRVELVSSKRNAELLKVELHHAEEHGKYHHAPATSDQFRAFKRGAKVASLETKTVFLPKPF